MNLLAALIILFNIAASAPRITAQSTPEVADLGAIPTFGEYITFRLRVQPVDDVQELLVFITPQGKSTVWQQISLEKVSSRGEVEQRVDVRQLSLYPFSQVTYRFEATLKNGSKIKTDSHSFEYDDTRFQWQVQGDDTFQIHWYGNDPALGQMILNIANQGLENAQNILAVSPPTPMRIYAYTSSRDLQSALQLTNQPWVAGHATPDLGMMLISVPSGPEKKLELERQIPHEIMHILQYQVMGSDFNKQPVWLVEGMASLAETYPNPEYRSVLESTASTQGLIPFRSLCGTFPRDAGGAFQAYAQSESFVRFLYNRYGSPGLLKLIGEYQNGLGCEEGFSAALGIPLNQAEHRWQQEELEINVGGLVLNNLSPYLLLGLLVLVPASLAFLPYLRKARSAEGKA